jgi:hypothetical protein
MGSSDSSVTSKRHTGLVSSEAMIADHVAAQLRGFLPGVFGAGQINYVLVCVLATADLKAKPWHPRYPRAVGPVCLFGGGHALIECDADPACLPPNSVSGDCCARR